MFIPKSVHRAVLALLLATVTQGACGDQRGTTDTPDVRVDVAGVVDVGLMPDADAGATADVESDALLPTDTGTDTVSTVRPMNLVVTANGVEIGQLMNMSEFTLQLWNSDLNIQLAVNDQTGFVTSYLAVNYYDDNACSVPLAFHSFGELAACGDAVLTQRPWIRREGGDTYGFTEPTGLLLPVGPYEPFNAQSTLGTDGCTDVPQSTRDSFRDSAICVRSLEPTTIIPTAFDLPILVEERTR